MNLNLKVIRGGMSWMVRNDIVFKKTKFNSILQVIFRGAYWLRFWAQLQHKEQAKHTLIAMSRKLEVVALQIVNRGWNIFFVYLSGGLLSVAAFFYPLVDGSFELCNNWLCTSSNVEAGFNSPISKKNELDGPGAGAWARAETTASRRTVARNRVAADDLVAIASYI
jgi:hypothetical protein